MPRSLWPLTMQSLAVTAVATRRMQTSLFRGRGSGTVLTWSTSGGPYAVQTTALMPSPAPGSHRGSRCHCCPSTGKNRRGPAPRALTSLRELEDCPAECYTAIYEAPAVTATARTVLESLVHIPSVTGDERRLAERVAEWCQAAGLDTELREVEPGRPNVVARLRTGRHPLLLLTGHLDTVPVGEGWT